MISKDDFLMNLIKDLYIVESQKAAIKEVRHTINTVNSIYNEWKKIKRRVNAVDIITTTSNKIGNISPGVIPNVHEATRFKIATLCMRCLDLPPWKPISERERAFKKLIPIISQLQNYDVKTGTGGSLREVIMTRIAAAYCYQNLTESGDLIFTCYEPKSTKKYLRYLFGDKIPQKTYKIGMLNIPENFQSLIDTIRLNHEKCVTKYMKTIK